MADLVRRVKAVLAGSAKPATPVPPSNQLTPEREADEPLRTAR